MSESPVTAPVCYRHPSKETYVRCTRCDRPICPDCMNAASVGHQCPECVTEGQRTQRQARTAFGGTTAGSTGTVTRTLIGINVAVMLVSMVLGGTSAVGGGGWGGLLGGSTPVTDALSVLGNAPFFAGGQPHGVAQGEWYRLVTAMFVHFGVLHLLMNMYALWILGRDLERALGSLRFAGLYLLAGLGGNVAAYLASAPNVPTAGASTAVFGLMAALFVVLKKLRLSVAPILPIIVINVIFTFVAPNISVPGHLGGLAVGALAMVVLAYAPAKRRDLVQGAGLGIILLALLLMTAYRTVSLMG